MADSTQLKLVVGNLKESNPLDLKTSVSKTPMVNPYLFGSMLALVAMTDFPPRKRSFTPVWSGKLARSRSMSAKCKKQKHQKQARRRNRR